MNTADAVSLSLVWEETVMGSAQPRGWCRCEVVDVQAELKYWKAEIHRHAFHEAGTPFSRYEPALRFAYDAYLRHHAQPLSEVLGTIHHKYVDCFDPWRALAWPTMVDVLTDIWLRMGAPLGARPVPGTATAEFSRFH